MTVEYLTLHQEMKRKKVTIDQIAKVLDCHRNSVYNKLYGKGNSDFTIRESIQIRDNFFQGWDIEKLFEPIKKTVQ